MTDRELLEAAAKAAGLEIFDAYKYDGQWMLRVYHEDKADGPWPWAPYHDDGDALRLAVKCGFIVDTNGQHSRVGFPFVAYAAIEPHGSDRYAATRRAVVRAAAAMAKDE